jgi:arylsulfatase A-like enzyme
MIVRWPGRVKAGAESATAWYFADVLPTLAELAGATVRDDVDGVSVVPTLLGQGQDLSDRFLYWEDFEGGFEQAVRWQNWKAIVSENDGMKLFNLSTDIGEDRDVAADHPEVVARINKYLETARTESENWPLNR